LLLLLSACGARDPRGDAGLLLGDAGLSLSDAGPLLGEAFDCEEQEFQTGKPGAGA
jgi:hypothetical protein